MFLILFKNLIIFFKSYLTDSAESSFHATKSFPYVLENNTIQNSAGAWELKGEN